MTEPGAVVRDYYRKFDARAGADELSEVFAVDAVYRRPGVLLRGRDAVREHLAGAPPVTAARHDLQRVIAHAGTVVVEGRMTGTLRARALDVPFVEIWDVENGLVTGRAAYFDTALLR